jgi:uncharacterized membrane protein
VSAEKPGPGGAPGGRPSTADLVLTIVNGVLVLAYPVIVWIGLSQMGPRAVSAMVLALLVPMLAIRLRKADRATFWSIVRVPIAILALVVLGALTDDARFVLAMPVAINLVLLATFGETLRAGQTPIIERFARLVDEDLSEEKQAHCRRWTVRWCAFFVLNAATALLLGLFATTLVWAAYTGGIAYALMGVMFAGEYLSRKARFREDAPRNAMDRLMARVFPPKR